ASRSPILERADLEEAASPSVHPHIRDAEVAARPSVRPARRHRVIDQSQQALFHLAPNPSWDLGEVQAQRDFPLTSANSIACSLIASVTRANSPSSCWIWTSRGSRDPPGFDAANAANAAFLA